MGMFCNLFVITEHWKKPKYPAIDECLTNDYAP